VTELSKMAASVKWEKVGDGEYTALDGRVRVFCPNKVDERKPGGWVWRLIVNGEWWNDYSLLRDAKIVVSTAVDSIMAGGAAAQVPIPASPAPATSQAPAPVAVPAPSAPAQPSQPVEMLVGEYDIPSRNLPEFAKAIAALNRHAAKLGCPPVRVVQGEEVVRDVTYWYTAYDVDGHPFEKKTTGKFLYTAVTVYGQEPRLNGWTLAAVLERAGDGTVIRNVPGQEIPAKYRTADPGHCEHCNKIRARKETFVLVHEDGRTVQVGRQCLKDFLGGNDPETIALLAERLFKLAGVAVGFGRGEQVYDTDEFLAYVVGSLRARQRPFISGAQAQRDMVRGGSTRDYALHYLHIHHGLARYDKRYDDIPYEPTSEEQEEAKALRQEAIVALQARSGEHDFSDFEHNLLTLVRMDTVTTRNMGTVAYTYGYVHKLREKAAEERRNAAQPCNEWAGTIGKRADFTLTCTGIRVFDGQFGERTLLSFTDADGRAFTWWTGWVGDDAYAVGSAYNVRGTVKAHDTYKGRNQTVLTRCQATPAPAGSVPVPTPAAAQAAPAPAQAQPGLVQMPEQHDEPTECAGCGHSLDSGANEYQRKARWQHDRTAAGGHYRVTQHCHYCGATATYDLGAPTASRGRVYNYAWSLPADCKNAAKLAS